MRIGLSATAARVGMLALATVLALCAVRGAAADPLILDVTFNSGDTITVTQPGGAPVGTTSGAPTVVAAGYYSIELSDTQGVSGPQFDLQGPGGTPLFVPDNLYEGEITSGSDSAYLAPNTTFTWRNDQTPSVVYTFETNGDIAGTASGETSSGGGGTVAAGGSSSSPTGASTTSSDVVGSALTPFRGTLEGAVSTAGKLSFTFKGKRVTELVAGRYTVHVDDRSKSAGFTLQETDRSAITVSGVAAIGTHSKTVDLTEGQWFYYPSFVGKKTYFYVTS